MNEETSARLAQEASNAPGETVNPDIIYECLWDGCDWQFEELNDLIEHCVSEPGGHVQQHFVNNPGVYM
jgi:protein polybromo-1